MNTTNGTFALAALFALAGCFTELGSNDAESSAASATRDPWSTIRADAHVLRLKEGAKIRTIGAPRKVKAALDALAGGGASQVGGAPRCPPSITFELSGADGSPIADVRTCSGTSVLHLGTAWFKTEVPEAHLRAIFDDPPAVGDVLWGVAAAVPSEGGMLDGARFMKGFKLDAVLGRTSIAVACPEDMGVSGSGPVKSFALRRDDGESIANVDLHCGADPDSSEMAAVITKDGETLGWGIYDLAATLSF